MDNWLSFMVADMLANGRLVSPMLEEWLTSDRPPLQAGLSLLFSGIIAGHAGLAYQVSSTWAQSLILLPVAMMLATVPSARARAIALVVVGLSPLVFFNALFVWPKLMAATYCALYHLILFRTDPRASGPAPGWTAAAAGVVAALALLSHGGSAFALAGSTLAFLAAGRVRALVPTLCTSAVAIVVYAPWVAYQKLVDPPGDRLVKWHFGGRIEVTEQSLVEVLRQSYGELSLQSWLAGRWQNVETAMSGTLRFFSDAGALVRSLVDATPGHASQPMVEASFFSTAYSLWFFGLAIAGPLLALALARRMPLTGLWPRGLPLATLLSLAAWITLMYIPGSTIIHAGSYFTTLALQLMVVLLAVRVAPALFPLLAACNVAIACALYVFDRPAAAWPSAVPYAVLASLLVAGFIAACLHGQRAWNVRPPAIQGSA